MSCCTHSWSCTPCVCRRNSAIRRLKPPSTLWPRCARQTQTQAKHWPSNYNKREKHQERHERYNMTKCWSQRKLPVCLKGQRATVGGPCMKYKNSPYFLQLHRSFFDSLTSEVTKRGYPSSFDHLPPTHQLFKPSAWERQPIRIKLSVCVGGG